MSDAEEQEEEKKEGTRAEAKTKGRSRRRNYFFASGHRTMESPSLSSLPHSSSLFLCVSSISLERYLFGVL